MAVVQFVLGILLEFQFGFVWRDFASRGHHEGGIEFGIFDGKEMSKYFESKRSGGYVPLANEGI